MAVSGFAPNSVGLGPIPRPEVLLSQPMRGEVLSTPSLTAPKDSLSISTTPAVNPPVPQAVQTAPAPFAVPANGSQVVYVPVLQALPGQFGAPAPLPSVSPQPQSQVLAPEPSLPELSLDEPLPPRAPGEPPTAKEIGQKVGRAVEHILNSNPEFLDDADRLKLDEPDAVIRQVHRALHPFVSWIPNPVTRKLVEQVPLEQQAIVSRFLDWLNTPTQNIPSFTATTSPPAAPPSSPSKREPLLEKISDEPISDPLAELFPGDRVTAGRSVPDEEKPSLAERWNPFNHLPKLRKDKGFEDELVI